jgi:hypothetical protein
MARHHLVLVPRAALTYRTDLGVPPQRTALGVSVGLHAAAYLLTGAVICLAVGFGQRHFRFAVTADATSVLRHAAVWFDFRARVLLATSYSHACAEP